MSAIVWSPTASQVETALASDAGYDLEIGKSILARLNSAGASYDSAFTQAVLDEQAASEAAFAAATATFNATYQENFEQVDRVARWAEGISLPPAGEEGEVFSSGAAIPFDADESPDQAATVTAAPMTLIARRSGTFGNTITATISDAATSEQFRLVVSRGSFSETYDPVTPGYGLVRVSRLILSPSWTSSSRPANGTYPLTGGTGLALATLQTRIARAATLTGLSTEQAAIVATYKAQSATIVANRPTFGAGKLYRPLIPIEERLEDALAEATAWLAAQ